MRRTYEYGKMPARDNDAVGFGLSLPAAFGMCDFWRRPLSVVRLGFLSGNIQRQVKAEANFCFIPFNCQRRLDCWRLQPRLGGIARCFQGQAGCDGGKDPAIKAESGVAVQRVFWQPTLKSESAWTGISHPTRSASLPLVF